MKDEDLPEGFEYATSEDLAKALGSPDPKRVATRLERLAGGVPELVKGAAGEDRRKKVCIGKEELVKDCPFLLEDSNCGAELNYFCSFKMYLINQDNSP